MPGDLLFMGVQEDPELDVWLGRGMVRVYDENSRPVPRPTAPPSGHRGGLWLTGGGRCICGGCLFEVTCPALGPPERDHFLSGREVSRGS